MNSMKRFWCRLTLHIGEQRVALGSYMGRRGPRYLYQCCKCRDYFSEPWQ